MRIIFLLIAVVLVQSSALAHNPLTAKFELNTIPQEGAILSIYLSQTGLHQTLIKHYPQKDFEKIEMDEYKKLIVQYLKEHISINADNTPLAIGEGGIKLGNHQTDLKFLIENYPKEVDDLNVHINAFNENENHHSVFWWKRKDGKSKIILSEKNNFRGEFSSGQEVVGSIGFFNKNSIWMGLGLSTLFFAIFFLFRKNKIAQKKDATGFDLIFKK